MIDKFQIKKILLFAPNWIGDAVLSIPAIVRIRESFPSSHITILGLPHISELFFECPYISEIFPFLIKKGKINPEGSKSLLTTVREIRRGDFDLTILFPNSFKSALIARLSGIPIRCGYNRDGRGFLLTIAVALHKKTKRMHQAEYYIRLVNSLESYFSGNPLSPPINPTFPPLLKGGEGGLPKEELRWGSLPQPYLYISKDQINQALETLDKNKITPDNFIVGINPGATYGSSKRWYPERFGQLARNMIQRYNVKIIVFGSNEETAIAEEIIRTAGLPLLKMTGKTSIRELMAIISRCKLFITNDSGPMHIAAALGVPVVAIFGSTDPMVSGPLGNRHIVIKKDVSCSPCFLRKCPTDLKCMDLISADDVLAGVEKIFG